MLYSLVTILFFCPRSDSYYKKLESLIGTESELQCRVTTFVTSAILSADYFCLVGYIPVMVTSQKLMTAHKSLLDVVYCRVTALDSCRVTELSGDCLY